MPFSEYKLSRLMLGTVQFGLRYGVANTTGQPSYETVRDILSCAHEGGVNCLDTAPGYGDSEEALGRAMSELGIANSMVVVTKVHPTADENSSGRSADKAILKSVTQSLKRLRLDVLPVCLFHNERDFSCIDSLIRLKENGMIRHVGVSVGTRPGPAATIVESGLVEAVQIPANILDHRHVQSGIFKTAHERGVAMFVRSVYLQGLLLMPEEDILPELAPVIPVRRKLQALADEAGMSMAELAVRYVLAIEGVTCALAGVESVAQMRRNIDLFSKPPLDNNLLKAATAAVPRLPEKILTPYLWPGAMR